MKIEHAGIQVQNPAEMADWYIAHLGFTCKRSADTPVPARFLADQSGSVMIEIYNNPKVTPPDYFKLDPLLFHLAFACDDLAATAARLMRAGAIVYSGPEPTPAGDELAMLRDPWGLPIQLCKRANPMLAT